MFAMALWGIKEKVKKQRALLLYKSYLPEKRGCVRVNCVEMFRGMLEFS